MILGLSRPAAGRAWGPKDLIKRIWIAARKFSRSLAQLWALFFLLKNIYLGGPGRYRRPYRLAPFLLACCGLYCVVPSLLCGESGPFVNFIGKTHMKNDKFKGSRPTLYLCPSVLCAGCGLCARCPLCPSSSTKTSLNNSKDAALHFCSQAADFLRGAFAIH